MKVKDLPQNMSALNIRVRIPDDGIVLSLKKGRCVYPVGIVWGTFFVSTDPPTKKQRKLYPILNEFYSLEEWEVSFIPIAERKKLLKL